MYSRFADASTLSDKRASNLSHTAVIGSLGFSDDLYASRIGIGTVLKSWLTVVAFCSSFELLFVPREYSLVWLPIMFEEPVAAFPIETWSGVLIVARSFPD